MRTLEEYTQLTNDINKKKRIISSYGESWYKKIHEIVKNADKFDVSTFSFKHFRDHKDYGSQPEYYLTEHTTGSVYEFYISGKVIRSKVRLNSITDVNYWADEINRLIAILGEQVELLISKRFKDLQKELKALD